MNYLDQIQRGVDYIEANLEQPISISAVASGAGLSQWHFQRIFKGLTGDTVKDYIVANKVEDSGFLVTGPLLGHEFCAQLETTISKLKQDGVGTRNLIEHSWCADLAKLIREHQLIAPFLSAATVAVQCTLFEKSQNQNWLVPVHQDLSIAVKERIAHPALTGWSEKEGSIFVQPPDSVL